MEATQSVAVPVDVVEVEASYLTLTVPSKTLMEFDQLPETGGGVGKLLTEEPVEIRVKSGVKVQLDRNEFFLVEKFVDDFNELPAGDSFETDHVLTRGTDVLMSSGTPVTLKSDMKARFRDQLTVDLPAGTKLQQKTPMAQLELRNVCRATIVKSFHVHQRVLGDRVVGGKIFVYTDNQKIQVFDADSRVLLHTIEPESKVTCMCLSPDNTLLVYACKSGKLNMLDTSSYQIVQKCDCNATYMSFSPCGQKLLVVLSKGLSTIDMTTYAITHLGTSSSFARYTPDNKYICCVNGKSVVLLDAAMSVVKSFDDLKDKATSMAISPDSKYVAVGCKSGHTMLYEIETGNHYKLKDNHNAGGNTTPNLCFSPCSSKLVVGHFYGSTGNHIRIWDVTTRKEDMMLEGDGDGDTVYSHKAFVNDVTYYGDKIVSVGNDKKLILWDAKTGGELCQIKTQGKAKYVCC